MYVKVKLNSKPHAIPAMLDTGSEVSIISYDLVKKLKLTSTSDTQWTTICGLGGKTISSFGSLIAEINFQKFANPDDYDGPVSLRLNILNKENFESLTLGMDLLKTFGLLIDYRGTFNKTPALITDPLWTESDPQFTICSPLYTTYTNDRIIDCQLNSVQHENCPFIKVTIENDQDPVLALCDTGSYVSIISLKLLQKVGMEGGITEHEDTILLQGVAGSPITARGTIILRVHLWDSSKTLNPEFVVIDENDPVAVILGMDTMTRYSLYLRLVSNKLIGNNNIVENLHYPDDDPYLNCRLLQYDNTYDEASKMAKRNLTRLYHSVHEEQNEKGEASAIRRRQLQIVKNLIKLLRVYKTDREKFIHSVGHASLQVPNRPIKEMKITEEEVDQGMKLSGDGNIFDIDLEPLEQSIKSNDPRIMSILLDKPWKLKNIEKIRIPANTRTLIWVTLPPKFEETFKGMAAIMEPSENLDQHLQVGSQIIEVGGRAGLEVLNMKDSAVRIHRNSILGHLTLIHPEDIFNFDSKNNVSPGNGRPIMSRSINVNPEPNEPHTVKEIETLLQENTWMQEIDISDKLDPCQKLKILRLIKQYQAAFSTSTYDLGLTDQIEFEIETTNTTPIAVAPYRLPYQKKQILQELLPDMLKAGIIEPSISSYNNPIVLIRKKTGDYRLCLDMRKLNEVTVSANLPIPNISECLDVLKGKNFFTSLDLNSAYHQISIKPADRHKTAFTINGVKYQYAKMLFGAKNAPFCWTHLMTKVLGPMNFLRLLVYLDDILVFSKGFQTHLERLEETFIRLIEAKLKLKPSKCSMGHSQTRFLGFIVSRNGLIPNPVKVMAIANLEAPRNVKGVQRLMGLLNYYSRWIENWQKTAIPITQLLRKDVPFKWDTECEQSFNILKSQLCNPPVLRGPDFFKRFILSCDASLSSSGAALAQEDDQGHESVIGYFSQEIHSHGIQVWCI